MTAVADSALSVVRMNMGRIFCVAGVAIPLRCLLEAFVDALLCATPVAELASVCDLTNLGGLESVTPVTHPLLFVYLHVNDDVYK
eukprot:3109424-Karenia_brevis.AAC.1